MKIFKEVERPSTMLNNRADHNTTPSISACTIRLGSMCMLLHPVERGGEGECDRLMRVLRKSSIFNIQKKVESQRQSSVTDTPAPAVVSFRHEARCPRSTDAEGIYFIIL